MSTADVGVIGAGVIGSSVAYELARDGRRMIVVDIGADSGLASLCRTGFVAPDAPIAPPARACALFGVYDVTDDWTPIYDRTELDGFYVAMGTSGNQFKNAPMAGLMMAALITAVENGHDHDADPVAYTCRRTGLVVDLGGFSRKRPFNAGVVRHRHGLSAHRATEGRVA